MSALSLQQRFCDPEKPWAAWQTEDGKRPLFIIGYPFDGQPHSAGNGQLFAFQANSRAVVDQCYQSALKTGGSCEGSPGLRPHYHEHFYGAYFRDPDGNKL
jgi:lactoylglutathione lyase